MTRGEIPMSGFQVMRRKWEAKFCRIYGVRTWRSGHVKGHDWFTVTGILVMEKWRKWKVVGVKYEAPFKPC